MTEPRPPVPSTGPAGSAQIPDELLSAYLDNAVSESERAAVERALAQDPEVVWRLDTLRQTVLLLKALPLPVLPRSFALESILAEAAAGETIFQGSALAGGPGPAAVARPAVGSSALSGTHVGHEGRAPTAQPAAAQRERASSSWGERWRAFWQAGSPLLRNAAAVSFALFLVVLAGGQMLTPQRPATMEAAASMEDAAGMEPAAIAEGPAAEAPAAVAGASALQKEATPTAAASAAAESAPAAEIPVAQGTEAQDAEADAGATAPTAFALSDEAPLVESAAAGSENAAETMVEAPAAAPAAAAEAPAEEAVDGTIVESAAAESAAPLAAAPAPAPLAGSELLAETPLAPADDSALGLGGMGSGIGGMGGGAPESEQGLGSALNPDALDGAAHARQSAPEAPAADSAPAAAARAAEESAAEGAAVEETSDQQMYATAASAEAPAASATAAPTPAPTPMPTAVPTPVPTLEPTAAPTEQVVAALPPASAAMQDLARPQNSATVPTSAAAPASAAARSPLLLLTWGLAGLSFALLLLWLRSRSRLQRD